MTTSREKAGCHPNNPFAIPDQCLNAAPLSFMDTPAWMQVVERRREQAAEEVLYAARGQEARSRPAKAGIQETEPGQLMGVGF